jgi:hypothetical protein
MLAASAGGIALSILALALAGLTPGAGMAADGARRWPGGDAGSGATEVSYG